MQGSGSVIAISAIMLLATGYAQAEIVSFLEGGFSWSSGAALPDEEITLDGKLYRPVIQGYPIGDWEDTQTLIQILQADVVKDSDLDKEVDQFMPPDEEDLAGESGNDLEVFQ